MAENQPIDQIQLAIQTARQTEADFLTTTTTLLENGRNLFSERLDGLEGSEYLKALIQAGQDRQEAVKLAEESLPVLETRYQNSLHILQIVKAAQDGFLEPEILNQALELYLEPSTPKPEIPAPEETKKESLSANPTAEEEIEVEEDFDDEIEDDETESDLDFREDLEDMLKRVPTVEDTNVYQYLKDISPYNRIPKEKQIELSKQREDGVEAKKKLIEEITDPEEKERLEETVKVGEEAKQQLAESLYRFAVWVARKHRGRGLHLSDLIQEANLGLLEGVNRYDWRRGASISTYAFHRIRQAANRGIQDKGRIIRLPVHINEQLYDIMQTINDLQDRFDRRPTNTEIAKELELDVERVRYIRAISIPPDDIDSFTSIGESTPVPLYATIPDNTPLEEQTEADLLSEELELALNKYLEPREAYVLKLRFGLEDGTERTLTELSLELDLSRERVRQIQAEAIRKLRRNRPFMRHFEDYLLG